MRAVLFDMDGTLVNTPDGIVTIARSMFPGTGEAEVRSSIGLPLPRVMARLCRDAEDSEAVESACATFRARFTEEVVSQAPELVFPGIRRMLAELRDLGVAVAVVTSKGTAGAEEMLQAAGLRDEVDLVVGYEHGRPGKPAPDQALFAASAFGLSTQECVVVGDSVDDARMARAAGMRVVGVSYGVADLADLMRAGVDTVVARPEALCSVLVGFITPSARALMRGQHERRLSAVPGTGHEREVLEDPAEGQGAIVRAMPGHGRVSA